jgi:beta-lactamase regulating signal transducer with metallopeptidase domain
MSGLFGGILEAVNFVGGVVLNILVGDIAWKETDAARRYRLWVGVFVVGIVLALVSFPLLSAIYDTPKS